MNNGNTNKHKIHFQRKIVIRHRFDEERNIFENMNMILLINYCICRVDSSEKKDYSSVLSFFVWSEKVIKKIDSRKIQKMIERLILCQCQKRERKIFIYRLQNSNIAEQQLHSAQFRFMLKHSTSIVINLN